MANPTITWGTKVIYVPKSFLTLIAGANYRLDTNAFRNALKDLEDDEAGMPFPKTHNHNTEVNLGGIVYARTLEIINGYTITFEDGQYAVSLTGSNNNIVDVLNLNQVSIRSNNSAGLVNLLAVEQATEATKYQIEALRQSHMGIGNVYFVSPIGNDGNTGLLPSVPKLTIAGALAACVSGRGDVINILASAAGQVTYAENIVVDKEDVHLRGPGRGVIIQPSAGDTITLSADNCAIEGLFVKTAVGSSADAIVINGKFAALSDLYIVGADTRGVTPVGNGNCIHIRGGDYHRIEDCIVEGAGGNGVLFTDAGLASGAPREVLFDRNQIYYNRGCGIKFTGTSANSTRMNIVRSNNAITHNSEYGIWFGANTQRNMVHSSNFIKDNHTFPSGTPDSAWEWHAEDGSADAMVDNMADTMPAAIWQRTLEGLTAEQMMRIMLAALAGKRQGLGTATEQYLAQDGTTPRITLTPDASGNGAPTLNGG